MNKFSQNLKAFRIKRNMSVRAFSQALSIPYTTYSNYEAGGEPKIDTLIKIADYLNISIDELLGYTPNEYEKTKEFLEKFNIVVNEMEDNTIQICCPIYQQPQQEDETLGFFYFANKCEFINFIHNASQEILENNIQKYIKNHIEQFTNYLIRKMIKSPKRYLKHEDLTTFLELIKSMSLDLEPPEANKKNPPPSEVGEGLKGWTPCNKS